MRNLLLFLVIFSLNGCSYFDEKEDQTKSMEDTKSDIGWGHQIRSYVLHPYRMVKDNRTNHESSNPDKVLDGDIDAFLESSLYN